MNPDPKFNDELAARFVNSLLRRGKKTIAYNIFYDTIDKISEQTKEDGFAIFKKAVENCKPSLEVRSRRVGGATYQVPVDVRPSRRATLSMRWIVEYARERGEKTMALRLAAEFNEAYNNRGNAIKKKDDVHRMAEANKAFSHYNW